MHRQSINPTDWGLAYQMDQGEIVEDTKRTLRCSGQIAVRPDPDSELGIAILHPGDIRRQTGACLTNIEAILIKAGMTRANLVSLRFFTTDIDGFLEHYDVYADWIAASGIRPPQSLIGVARLVLPEIVIEIEAEAAI